MNEFTLYGGKIKWTSNQGVRVKVVRETDKAKLLSCYHGEFWMPKSTLLKNTQDNGFGQDIVRLPFTYEIKIIDKK